MAPSRQFGTPELDRGGTPFFGLHRLRDRQIWGQRAPPTTGGMVLNCLLSNIEIDINQPQEFRANLTTGTVRASQSLSQGIQFDRLVEVSIK